MQRRIYITALLGWTAVATVDSARGGRGNKTPGSIGNSATFAQSLEGAVLPAVFVGGGHDASHSNTKEVSEAAPAAQLCVDLHGWVALDSSTCEKFASANWCTPDRQTGQGWDSTRGTIDDYAKDDISAFEACCACGGGDTVSARVDQRARRQGTESVEIVGTAGVLMPISGSFSVDVTFSTATAGATNLRCLLRAFMPDGTKSKLFQDVVELLTVQTGTVTITFNNYIGTEEAWNNSMPVLWAFTEPSNNIGYANRIAGPDYRILQQGTPIAWTTAAPSNPTHIPTAAPTHNPTASPTSAPTSVPTDTDSPSESPTAAPTITPTHDPTGAPSHLPTEPPSTSPTTSPTSTPSTSPTKSPTIAPTDAPSHEPTTTPTVHPTSAPSNFPTEAPSHAPTMIPTSEPTVVPSQSPSMTPTSSVTSHPTTRTPTAPTAAPSLLPTSIPTLHPTFTQTSNPSTAPSNQPTPIPTITPTSDPTTSPSISPTAVPTALTLQPTSLPTFSPSSTPTAVSPTSIPTAKPSNNPTAKPTAPPTIAPTMFPTAAPTPMPSFFPTSTPTTSPFASPTTNPSALPTMPPTVTPTANPSMSPTTSTPTKTPTTSPTFVPSVTPSAVPTVVPTYLPSNSPTDTPSSLPTESPSVDGAHITLSTTYNFDYSLLNSFGKNLFRNNVFTEIAMVYMGVNPTYTFDFIAASLFDMADNDDGIRVSVQGSPAVTTVAIEFLPGTISSDDSAGVVINVTQQAIVVPANGFGQQSSTSVFFEYLTFSPTALPTVFPTAGPTPVPTASPTVDPSASPSTPPTAVPTASPTARPTTLPTAQPTGTPTVAPTAAPTISPTASPTELPTGAPSARPTSSPTAVPTKQPTVSPTTSPTASPTTAPTNSPTISPTAAPTVLPTALPTLTPTDAPTSSPTSPPTAVPTTRPTAAPTAGPTSAPTTAPTSLPTIVPTASPTSSPTASPTKGPIAAPTGVPTTHPTASPTAAPTEGPTVRPTASPTVAPTSSPTAAPTERPTVRPTAAPTVAPTSSPTAAPTEGPTVRPTASPTVAPTSSPTAAPTERPTVRPTASPTVAPTSSPTAIPSYNPTALPTASPTTAPSASPTALPTPPPTQSPSGTPTSKPTAEPTTTPTAAPSASPTSVPTSDPTANPTGLPTMMPTTSPSAEPTLMPSSSPTGVPTSTPTVTPTSTPTGTPTASPSLTPTAAPTAAPSGTPTSEPSASPTLAPSSPTAIPTSSPTASPTFSPTAGPTAVPSHMPTESPTVIGMWIRINVVFDGDVNAISNEDETDFVNMTVADLVGRFSNVSLSDVSSSALSTGSILVEVNFNSQSIDVKEANSVVDDANSGNPIRAYAGDVLYTSSLTYIGTHTETPTAAPTASPTTQPTSSPSGTYVVDSGSSAAFIVDGKRSMSIMLYVLILLIVVLAVIWVALRRIQKKRASGLPTKALLDYEDHKQLSPEEARRFLAQQDTNDILAEGFAVEEVEKDDDKYDAKVNGEWQDLPQPQPHVIFYKNDSRALNTALLVQAAERQDPVALRLGWPRATSLVSKADSNESETLFEATKEQLVWQDMFVDFHRRDFTIPRDKKHNDMERANTTTLHDQTAKDRPRASTQPQPANGTGCVVAVAPSSWATTHSSHGQSATAAQATVMEFDADENMVEALFEYLASPGESSPCEDACRPVIAVTSVPAPIISQAKTSHTDDDINKDNSLCDTIVTTNYVDVDEKTCFEPHQHTTQGQAVTVAVVQTASLRPEMSPELIAYDRPISTDEPLLSSLPTTKTTLPYEPATPVGTNEHTEQETIVSPEPLFKHKSLRPVLSPDPVTHTEPSHSERTHQPPSADPVDIVRTSPASAVAQPLTLSGFLGRLNMTAFESGLRELGAEVPSDLAHLDDDDCFALGMKKLQKRKLEAALAPLRGDVNGNGTVSTVGAPRVLSYL